MKQFIKCIFILPILLLLAACTMGPQRMAISKQNQKTIHDSKVVLNTTQKGIRMQPDNWFSSDKPNPYDLMDSGYIVRSNSDMGAPDLLTAVIDIGIQDHISNKMKAGISSERRELSNFDYINIFKDDLNQKLSALSWLKLHKMEVKYDIKRSASKIVNESNTSSTLFIGTTYALNSTFERLEVATYVKLFKKQKNNKSPLALYKNNFYFIYYLPEKNEAKENEIIWEKNNGKLLKKKLIDASSILSSAIAKDLNNSNIIHQGANKNNVTIKTIDGTKEKANIIGRIGDYYILSLVSGGAIYIEAISSRFLNYRQDQT